MTILNSLCPTNAWKKYILNDTGKVGAYNFMIT